MAFKVYLISLGCAKNLVDTEVMIKTLRDNNYKIIEEPSSADIIIINTCGFIEKAKQESINTIIEMGYYKLDNKCKVLIAAGCLSERYKDELLSGLPELDAVIGTGDYKKIAQVIFECLNGERIGLNGNQENVDIQEIRRYIKPNSYTSYIKIAEGCDNKCTYCVIPSIRGKYRSRRIEKIIDEVKQLAKIGVKEIIIIAQDTTKYGIDLYGKPVLSILLKQLANIEGIEWIRLLYTYPDEFDDDLIETIASEKKICKYLDIPIQHANDKILKNMGRHTSKAKILNLINKLRERIPEIVLRTSLIVGFPGETNEDFLELLSFVKNIRFERLGVFTYSKEEGTPAYNLNNHIDFAIKEKRQEIIMSTQMDLSLENNNRLKNKILKVLVEGYEDGKYFGRSYRDAPDVDGLVYFTSKRIIRIGEFYDIHINDIGEYDLFGECIDEYCK